MVTEVLHVQAEHLLSQLHQTEEQTVFILIKTEVAPENHIVQVGVQIVFVQKATGIVPGSRITQEEVQTTDPILPVITKYEARIIREELPEEQFRIHVTTTGLINQTKDIL